MKVLVCGGRYYSDRRTLYGVLDGFHAEKPITELISGAASGADTLAAEWARSRGINLTEFPANWKSHGSSAGPRRNKLMLKQNPDVVIAFPGGRGTDHMCTIAEDAGVFVQRVPSK